MPKDAKGNKLTWKQYIARWKQGIQLMTPYQQLSIQYRSTWIMLFGIIAGIIICLFSIKTLWWLMIILVGALGSTATQQVGLYQRKNMFKKLMEANANELIK